VTALESMGRLCREQNRLSEAADFYRRELSSIHGTSKGWPG
jgi:hypothetical protein